MIFTFAEFQAAKKRSTSQEEIDRICSANGWNATPYVQAILIYPEELVIVEMDDADAPYSLTIANMEYGDDMGLDQLERILYAYYCSEYCDTAEDLKIMAAEVNAFEWGSTEQINIENGFVSLASQHGFVEDDAWEAFSLKATTPEMVDYILNVVAGSQQNS